MYSQAMVKPDTAGSLPSYQMLECWLSHALCDQSGLKRTLWKAERTFIGWRGFQLRLHPSKRRGEAEGAKRNIKFTKCSLKVKRDLLAVFLVTGVNQVQDLPRSILL